MRLTDRDDDGRTRILGVALPFTKPTVVRDIDDVHTLMGGMRKPKQADPDRAPELRRDLSGGGYTSMRNRDGMGRQIAMFMAPAVVVFLVAGYFGWRATQPPEPIESSCADGRYEATYERALFDDEATAVVFRIDFDGFEGSDREVRVELPPDPDAEIVVSAQAISLQNATHCRVRSIEEI